MNFVEAFSKKHNLAFVAQYENKDGFIKVETSTIKNNGFNLISEILLCNYSKLSPRLLWFVYNEEVIFH